MGLLRERRGPKNAPILNTDPILKACEVTKILSIAKQLEDFVLIVPELSKQSPSYLSFTLFPLYS